MKIYKISQSSGQMEEDEFGMPIYPEVNDSDIDLSKKSFFVPQSHREIAQLVSVNTQRFDDIWKKDSNFYVGPNGSQNSIGDRYKGFKYFLMNNDSIEASAVEINNEGEIFFGNGRNRYAVLRDLGMQEIPVALTQNSIRNAKKLGII